MSSEELEVVVVPSGVDLDDDSFNPISNFYIINSLGDYYFIKTKQQNFVLTLMRRMGHNSLIFYTRGGNHACRGR